jgi:methanogen homocitrate synthase
MGMSERTENWWVSQYNFVDEVRKEMSLPSKLEFHDVSLRDGEQQPGIVFRKDEKIKIAQLMNEVGIHRIEAGMPLVSQEDFDAIKTIAGLGLSSQVFCLARIRKDDVDVALKCDVNGIILETPSSDVLIEKGFGWTRQKVIDMTIESATYAKEHGLRVVYFPYDTTKANWEFERQLMQTAVEQGHVDAVTIVDTFGVCLPQAMAYFVRKVRDAVKVPVEVHCHNDLGMATANALAGIAAGAEGVHTCVNGIGERCGNTPFEEVAVGVRVLLGLETGFKYDKLYALSKMVEEFSGSKLAPGKPIVGENPFKWESGIAVMFLNRLRDIGLATAATAIMPEFVGQKFQVVLGKKSGKHSIEAKLKELGLEASDEQIEKILAKVKDLSIKKKRVITDAEFKRIVRSAKR